MTDFSAWFSPAVMRLVAWALLHFLWQGLVLAAVFAGLMAIARTAATRYALAVSILILMVAAPIATFLFLRQSVSIVHPVATIFRTPTPALAAAKPMPAGSMQAMPAAGISPDTFLWLVRIWIAGVIFFSLRTAGGMLVIERLQRRKAAPVAHRVLQTCLDLQRTVGIKRAVRFCQCNGLDVPAVIGWFRPIVLLPMTVLAGLSQAQLEAVIAHELAHIKRWDYFVNLFQIAAETVLFYHPAVWWVSRRIRLERENCCDDMAVELCGNVVDYARALTYMEGGRTAPSLVMAASGSPLAARVLRLLGARKSGGNVLGTGLAIGVVCLAGGILISQAFVRVAHADLRQGPATISQAKISASPKVITASSSAKPATELAVRPMVLLAQLAPPAPPAAALPAPETPPTPPTQATTSDQAPGQGSYIESLKAVGLDNLSVDDLVAMKIQGVTADYVRQLHDLGLKPGADDLIAMRIQGVTPEYIRDMRAGGITGNADDLVAMKIQGVTPEYLRSLHDLGLKPGADDLIAMRIQRVTPEYIRDVRALGLNPSADDLVAMQIQGVTPAYIKELSAAGISKLTADDYIAAKVQGITPEFVEKARQHGFHNLDLDQLLALKRAGIL
jgi:beta-lactamase regulating signal transducer with metallopeptidase domain